MKLSDPPDSVLGMGVKTGFLVVSDGSAAEALRRVTDADVQRSAELVGRLRPGSAVTVEPGLSSLADAVYPPKGTVCALSAPGVDVLGDQELMIDYPSQLPAHLVAASKGRRMCLHAMHSVVDWLAFAVWEDGSLVRSLSVSPDDGVLEDVGDRLPFENPYWDGRFPLDWVDEDDDPYPLPFHPLELGERAMLELFGFRMEGFRTLEGEVVEQTVDAWQVPVPAFRLD
jgi:hypothetical protein